MKCGYCSSLICITCLQSLFIDLSLYTVATLPTSNYINISWHIFSRIFMSRNLFLLSIFFGWNKLTQIFLRQCLIDFAQKAVFFVYSVHVLLWFKHVSSLLCYLFPVKATVSDSLCLVKFSLCFFVCFFVRKVWLLYKYKEILNRVSKFKYLSLLRLWKEAVNFCGSLWEQT